MRVRVGVVGLQFGREIVARLRRDGSRWFEAAAICGNTPAKVERAAAELALPGIVGLEALLREPDIPVIGLFTGPEGRAGLIRQIIRAGKDVITTKPFETDAAAAAEVLREARALGRMIYVNSPSSAPSDDMRQFAAWQRERGLGRALSCRADTWIAYNERADGTWYDDPLRCPVAPVLRLGIYVLHDMIRLLGPVEQVSAASSSLLTGRPTADHGQLALKFAGGALGSVFASFCVDDGQRVRHALTVNYERGTVYRNVPTAAARSGGVPASELLLVTRGDCGGLAVERASFAAKSGDYQWERIYRHLVGEQRMECPEDIIVQGVRVIEAMAEADRSGRWVHLNRKEGLA